MDFSYLMYEDDKDAIREVCHVRELNKTREEFYFECSVCHTRELVYRNHGGMCKNCQLTLDGLTSCYAFMSYLR